MTARDWIAILALAPHPEGGWFREVYRATESIDPAALPARFEAPRSMSTAVYYLLEQGQCSRLHRIRSDELWHFYDGDPLTVWWIDPAGELATFRLGRSGEDGTRPLGVVPAGAWFGAAVDAPGTFALVGCTVAPGFDYADFEIADRGALMAAHPRHRALIERLTPPH